MEIRKPLETEFDLSRALSPYSLTYLKQYWPETPDSAVGWADNAVLMLAYQDAALSVKEYFQGRLVRMLDISTGPALGPLLAMHTCVSDVQLSDYYEENRISVQRIPIEYWRNYAPMLTKLFRHPERNVSEILSRLDQLRMAHIPVEVDLFRSPPFPASIKPKDFDLISMQFVADSITNSVAGYLGCLQKVAHMVRPGAALIMSATVDCDEWKMGPHNQPSPSVSEETIVEALQNHGLSVINLTRSMRQAGLTYSGGWIVLAAVKET